MPWSKTLPKGVERRVTRASLPSTVSRKHIPQAQARPSANAPVQNSAVANSTSTKLTAVTTLGEMPKRAQNRVTWKAGQGQTRLVTKSVTPL